MKLNYSASDPQVFVEIEDRIAHFWDGVTVVDATFTINETKNFVRCCDCFLSLHRSEGFGRGPAEAMFIGKPSGASHSPAGLDISPIEQRFSSKTLPKEGRLLYKPS
ncbi:MAG: glycosyltransferase [Candidatus Binataceae bacterium]